MSRQKRRKNKTAEEKLWVECNALGRKLDGMSAHAAQIVAQSQEENNDWQWAKEQRGPLADEIENIEAIVHTWSTYVRTSSLAFLQKKQGAAEAAGVWLNGIEKAKKIAAPFGELVGMHSIMLSE